MQMQESRVDHFDEYLLGLGQVQERDFGQGSSVSIRVLGSLRGDEELREAALEAWRSWPEAAGDGGRWFGRRLRIVIVASPGPLALLASVCRFVSRRFLLFVYFGEPPRPFSWLRRFTLRRADRVLVHGDATSLAISGLGKAPYRIRSKDATYRYLAVPLHRPQGRARRMVVVGDLTPGSGAFDLLAASAAWAELNAGQSLVLSWAGEGDLAGMLAAQPLPDNLSQTFHGVLDDHDLAPLFEQGDLLAVPCVADNGRSHVAQALAAGLPVLGSRRSGAVRRHVADGATGWLFDPLRPGEMLDAVACALSTSDERLTEMRLRARAAVSAPSGMPIAGAERQARQRSRRRSARLRMTTGAP